MIKATEGVYRYDEELFSNEVSLVLVHPWYNEKENKFKLFNTNRRLFNFPSSREAYLKNIDE